jgi:hypothetical protein
MVDQGQLGYKAPLPGYNRLQFCPACVRPTGGVQIPLTSQHVLLCCSAVDTARKNLAISTFVSACRLRGLSDPEIYSHYVTGMNWEGTKVTESEHQDRGKALGLLQDKWLGSWGAASRSTARSRLKKSRTEEET